MAPLLLLPPLSARPARTDVRLLDTKSGKQRLVQGPATVVPEPLELADDVLDAVKLEEMHYAIVTNTLNGAQRVVQGPTLLFPGVFETIEPTQSKVALKKNEYAKVVDDGTGNIRVVRGPQVLVPEKATERLGRVLPAYELQKHQYIKLVDQATGQVRVERGEAIIFPGPNEEAVPSGDESEESEERDDQERATTKRRRRERRHDEESEEEEEEEEEDDDDNDDDGGGGEKYMKKMQLKMLPLEKKIKKLQKAEAKAIEKRDEAEEHYKGPLAFDARGAAQKALHACNTECQRLRATMRKLQAQHATACRRVQRLERDPADAEKQAKAAAAAAKARAETRKKERERLNVHRAQKLADNSDGKQVNYSESGDGQPLGRAGVYGGVRCSVQKKVPHPHHPERKVSVREASHAEWKQEVHGMGVRVRLRVWRGLPSPNPNPMPQLLALCLAGAEDWFGHVRTVGE